MKFIDIIKSEITNLPLERSSSEDFRDYLFHRLDAFDQIISQSQVLSSRLDFNEHIFKSRNHTLIKGIKGAINGYYEGNPNKAYTILSKALKTAEISGYLNKQHYLGSQTNLFRIRQKEGSYSLRKGEIFHIPFHLRERVATQRFSIPGLPTLYLSNSIYVAWEELGRPDSNYIQASRFSNTRELRLLDLTNDLYKGDLLLDEEESYNWNHLYSVMIWPLVASCSIKVPDRKVTFKPEYIVPQLLLQWINKNSLDGIKYSSTHINRNKVSHEGEMYNVVVPVKSFNQSSGFCKRLTDLFELTDVIPMNLINIERESDVIDRVSDLLSIEIYKGRKVHYEETSFGYLERKLKRLQLSKIL